MREIAVVLEVEGKDEWSGGGPVADGDIDPQWVATVAQDELADSTRGDYELPFMVRKVRF